MIRQAEKMAAVADRLGVHGGAGEGAASLHKAVAVVQHHDAITGTEREVVASDYHKRLHSAVEAAFLEIGIEPSYDGVPAIMPSFCPLLNISQCPPLDALESGGTLRLEMYNPLARAVQYTIRYSQYSIQIATTNIGQATNWRQHIPCRRG